MKLSYNTTIHLTADDLKQLLIDHFKKEGVKVDSLEFDVTKELCGFGTAEHECVTFKGVTVRLGK